MVKINSIMSRWLSLFDYDPTLAVAKLKIIALGMASGELEVVFGVLGSGSLHPWMH